MSSAPRTWPCAGEVPHARGDQAGHSPAEEDALLGRPRQAALLTAGVAAVTAVVFALVADHGMLTRIQRLDDAWLRLMISGRTPPLTAIAKVFNVLGLVSHAARADRPGRVPGPAPPVVASGRFRGRHRAVGGADRLAEGRLRPDQAARVAGRDQRRVVPVRTRHRRVRHHRRGVIALVPAGGDVSYGPVALAFSIVMGLSRAYLAAHWLSDATAGILLGTSCALATALSPTSSAMAQPRQRPARRDTQLGFLRPAAPGAVGERHEYGPDTSERNPASDPPTASEPSPGAPEPITSIQAVPAVDSLPSSGRCHPPDRQRPGPDRDARRSRGGSRPADGPRRGHRDLARI